MPLHNIFRTLVGLDRRKLTDVAPSLVQQIHLPPEKPRDQKNRRMQLSSLRFESLEGLLSYCHRNGSWVSPRKCDSCSVHVAVHSAQDLTEEFGIEPVVVHPAEVMFLDPVQKWIQPENQGRRADGKSLSGRNARLGYALSI